MRRHTAVQMWDGTTPGHRVAHPDMGVTSEALRTAWGLARGEAVRRGAWKRAMEAAVNSVNPRRPPDAWREKSPAVPVLPYVVPDSYAASGMRRGGRVVAPIVAGEA